MSETPVIYKSGNVIFLNRSGSHYMTSSPPPEYLPKKKKPYCKIIHLPDMSRSGKNMNDQIGFDEENV